MVKMLNNEDFFNSLGSVWRPKMNMSVCNGKFECACGEYHQYEYSIKLLAEGGGMRVVMQCPKDHNFFTNVSIKNKGFFRRFDKFETISGTKALDDENRIIMLDVFSMIP
jgi:hypothetical protein